jgi:COP9 signalosome complex subunit 1
LLSQPELELDLYLSDHVEHLCKEIRSHAITQFFYPYLSVDLRQMAQTFSTDTAALEKEVCELIDAGRLAARIDSYQKVQQRSAAISHQRVPTDLRCFCFPPQILYAHQPNKRSATYARALKVGRKYAAESRNLLLRMSLLKNGVVVRDT